MLRFVSFLAVAAAASVAHSNPSSPSVLDPIAGSRPTGGTTLRPGSDGPKTPDDDKWRPPFIVEVAGPDRPMAHELIRVRIQVERDFLDETPLLISARLPDGVALVQGELEERIIDPSTRRIVREWELEIGQEIPAGDVVITVQQRGEGWGGNAVKAYRFGRPEPASLTAPLRRGKAIDLGEGVIVRPILLD